MFIIVDSIEVSGPVPGVTSVPGHVFAYIERIASLRRREKSHLYVATPEVIRDLE